MQSPSSLWSLHGFILVLIHFLEKNKKRPSKDDDSAEPSAKVAKQEEPGPQLQSYKSKLNETVMKMRLDLPTYSTVRTAGGFLSTLVLNGQGKN
jgi:hypothetical protein